MAALSDFPDALVIQLRKDPSVEFVAQSTHVTNAAIEAFGARPTVVTTFGRGVTPMAALTDLLENVNRREST